MGGSCLSPTPVALPQPGCPSRRAVIYLNIQVVKGQRTVISLLKEQISNVSACVPEGSRLAPSAPPPASIHGPGV